MDRLPPGNDAAPPHWVAGMLDLVLEFGRMALFQRNLRTGEARWSPQMYRLFGFDPGQPPPAMPEALRGLHPDDSERALRELGAAAAQVGRHESRFRLLTPDGQVRHVHALSEVRAGADGDAEWIAGVLIDDSAVVERVEAQERLSARLNQALNLASVWIWRVDLATERVEFNDHGYRITGFAPEPGGVPLADVRATIHPDDADAVLRAADEALHTSHVVDVEARYRRPEGGYRQVLTRRVAERDAAGRPIALAGVSMDQTQQVAERERARSLAQRIDIVTRAAGVGVWSIDIASRAVEWNEQMFRIYGLPPAGTAPSLEQQIETLLHPEDREMVLRQRARADQAGRRGLQFEFRIVRPDGTVRWLSTWSRREHTPDDRVMAYGVTIDVTERKLAEQALRDKASAEQASRAKSEFLSRMSHELRTPLNAVLGFSQMLLHDADDGLSSSQSDRVRQIHSAGLHLMALIDDVLDLASIESTTLQLDLQPVPLQAAVDDVLQWTQAQAQRAGIAIQAEATPGWVRCDARRLRQILANLLSNAIKYNRAGGRVWIRARRDPAPGADSWQLIVRDSGRGIPAQQRAHLFEPFNRLGAEREGIQGTGIGLAIVRHLVDLMGGRIEVDSEPEQGSEFRVCLPAAASPATAAQRPAMQPPPGQPGEARPLTVLYIEDNPINVMLVEQLMALRPAMRLLTAPDGTSGVALARSASPEVLLIDMQLPDFDGFEVLSRLRADPPLQARAFIALSASAMPDEVQRAKLAGFNDYWTKPIDFAQFLNGLDALAKAR
jgi:PAS domain S-box-containing protein